MKIITILVIVILVIFIKILIDFLMIYKKLKEDIIGELKEKIKEDTVKANAKEFARFLKEDCHDDLSSRD